MRIPTNTLLITLLIAILAWYAGYMQGQNNALSDTSYEELCIDNSCFRLRTQYDK